MNSHWSQDFGLKRPPKITCDKRRVFGMIEKIDFDPEAYEVKRKHSSVFYSEYGEIVVKKIVKHLDSTFEKCSREELFKKIGDDLGCGFSNFKTFYTEARKRAKPSHIKVKELFYAGNDLKRISMITGFDLKYLYELKNK